jgi:DNA-binding NtrC family response regulator
MSPDPLRVLFVDDEDELVSAVVERLEIRGLHAVGETSGSAALERLEAEDFDVVVVDVKMPGIGGLEVIRRIKDRMPNLEVILLSGHGSAGDTEEGLRLGAYDYLMKPIKIDVLVEHIRQAAMGREIS